MAVKNEKNAPGVIASLITRKPPYQMIAATPTTPMTSMCDDPKDDT